MRDRNTIGAWQYSFQFWIQTLVKRDLNWKGKHWHSSIRASMYCLVEQSALDSSSHSLTSLSKVNKESLDIINSISLRLYVALLSSWEPRQSFNGPVKKYFWKWISCLYETFQKGDGNDGEPDARQKLKLEVRGQSWPCRSL